MVDLYTGIKGRYYYDKIHAGGGGYCTGIDIHQTSGDILVRTDTFNSYIKHPDDDPNEYRDLLTVSNWGGPAAAYGDNSNNGGYEAVFAPNDANYIYTIQYGVLFKSVNKAVSFTLPAGWVACPNNSNTPGGGSPRITGPRMAVDPGNKEHLIVCTQQDGIRRTTNGGTSFATNGTIAAGGSPTEFDNQSVVAFNPADPNEVMVYRSGTGGYRSTDNGAIFALTSGTPTGLGKHLICTAAGVFYLADGTSAIKKCVAGTWTSLAAAPTNVHAIAVDPSNANRIVAVSESGPNLCQSLDGGANWTFFGSGVEVLTISAEQVPWQSNMQLGFDVGDIKFHPNGELYATRGVGVLRCVMPSSFGTIPWFDDSMGIETLATNQVQFFPNDRAYIVSWDRPVFTWPSVPGPVTYASTYGPDIPINSGWDLDYFPADPDYVVTLVNGFGQQSGWSQNRGNSFTPFTTFPNNPICGNIVVGSTKDKIVVVPSNGRRPFRSDDRGVTWTEFTIPGTAVYDAGQDGSWLGWHNAYFTNRKVLVRDKVNDDIYIYNSGSDPDLTNGGDGTAGVYRTSDDAVTWTKVYDGHLNANLFDSYNTKMVAVYGHAGHLFWCDGGVGTTSHPVATCNLMRSTNGGATWTDANANLREPMAIGIGAPAPGASYPTVFVVGWYFGVYGMYASIDNCASFIFIADAPNNSLGALGGFISGDPLHFGNAGYTFGGGTGGFGRFGTRFAQA